MGGGGGAEHQIFGNANTCCGSGGTRGGGGDPVELLSPSCMLTLAERDWGQWLLYFVVWHRSLDHRRDERITHQCIDMSAVHNSTTHSTCTSITTCLPTCSRGRLFMCPLSVFLDRKSRCTRAGRRAHQP